MIVAVFDPSPLTTSVNCSLFYIYNLLIGILSIYLLFLG